MTQPHDLPQPYHASLLHCLNSLAGGCPEGESSSSPLSKLREAASALTSENGIEDGTPTAALAPTDALTLIDAGRGLLAAIRSPSGGGLPNAQLGDALDAALEGLAAGIGADIRRQQADRVRGLYVIIDPEVTGGRDPMEIARAAVRGGASMLQLRDKLRDKGEILPLAQSLQQLCEETGVLLIMNDHVDLAATVVSGGVHVGQTDMPVAEVRKLLAPHQVLGRSNRQIDLLIQSQMMGADHVAFGAIYTSTTKGGGRGPQGVEPLRRARAATRVPLVAIGGINAENVAPVVEAGADAICVTAAVGSAPEPEAAANQLVEAIRSAGGRV